MFVVRTSPSEFQSSYTLEKLGEYVKDLRIAAVAFNYTYIAFDSTADDAHAVACGRNGSHSSKGLLHHPRPQTSSAKLCFIVTF